MKRNLVILLVLIFILGIVNAVSALTLRAVDGTWTGAAGGKYIHYYDDVDVSYGNGSEEQIRWGDPATDSGQSGLGFTGTTPDSSFNMYELFEIGQLRHYNNPIYSGSAASGASLALSLSFSEPVGLGGGFSFTFDIDETLNQYGDERDNDIITFPSIYASETFEIGGVEYTLELLGFGNNANEIVSSFASPEGGTNATTLWGRITAKDTCVNPVPEPSSFLLLGAGLLGLAGYTRKQSKK